MENLKNEYLNDCYIKISSQKKNSPTCDQIGLRSNCIGRLGHIEHIFPFLSLADLFSIKDAKIKNVND